MLKRLIPIALLSAGLAFAECSQPVFVEEADALPDEPPTESDLPTNVDDDTHHYDLLQWEGETEKFRFEYDGSIRLYDESGEKGTAYLSAPLSTPDRTCWQMYVRLSFNPSANNHLRIYLMADSPALTSGLNGYFLQVGGEEDRIYLYRQQGDSLTLLARTEVFMRGDTSPEAHIRVERDSQGYFQLYVSEISTSTLPLAFIKDTAVRTGGYCGFVCIYTASNSRKMRLQVFRIHHDVRDVEELESGDFRPSPPAE